MHWAALRRDLAPLVQGVYRDACQQRPAKPHLRVKLTITLYRLARDAARDPDSLAISCKELIDAVVQAGIVVDDSERHLDLVVRQDVGPKRQVVLEIVPLVRA